jgi:transcription elongation factor Elf1
VCLRKDCDNLFLSYPSENRKYCSNECRYKSSDTVPPSRRTHILSDIDEELKTANCVICGKTEIKARINYSKNKGKTLSWRCRTSIRASAWFRKYGLTREEISKILIEQEFSCPICGKELLDDFVVDHNHETGEVRGLLHANCNTALGMLEDDIGRFYMAIQYLEGDYDG